MIDNFALLLSQWFNVCVAVVTAIIPTVSTFVFVFSARLFSGVTFWTVYRAQMMIDNSKAFLLFFGTPLLLFRMFSCSNYNSFCDGVFVYGAIFFSLSFHLKSTKWRTFTLSLLLYVDFVIIERFAIQKKMKN